jgi:hypothetical protein
MRSSSALTKKRPNPSFPRPRLRSPLKSISLAGFLSPDAWRANFLAAGFRDVTFVPDIDAVAARYPKFFVGAVIARL